MKRFLSLLLVFALVLSCTPVLPIQVQAATEEQSSFDGYTAISTKEELDAIRNDLSGKYYLAADIVFTDEDFAEGGAFYNNGAKWIPIGTSSAPFIGTFDGNGHTITGLSVLVKNTENAVGGLFGYVSSSDSEYGIFNLGMISDYILVSNASGRSYAGSIAGYCETGKIEGCYHTGHVAATNTSGEIYAGGIVGYKQYGEINKCYNVGSVVGGGITGGIVGGTTYAGVSNCYNNTEFDGKYAGGIVGSASFGTVETCYSLGTNSSSYGSGFAGGIVGMNSNCTVSNSYYDASTTSGGGTYKSTSAMQSQSTFSGFDFTDIWTMDGNSDYPYPELQGVTMRYERTLTSISVSKLPTKTEYIQNEENLDVTGGVITLTYNDGTTSTVAMTADMVTGFNSSVPGEQALTVTYGGKITSFFVSVQEENTVEFLGGNGTESSPYLISNVAHLDNVRNYLDAHYLLVCDISFGNDPVNWNPIGTIEAPFTGVFDGNGYSINNLSVIVSTGSNQTAGLFGAVTNGKINNLKLSNGSVQLTTSGNGYAGSIAGFVSGSEILECSSNLSVSLKTTGEKAYSYCGGIVGYATDSSLSKCVNNGTISSEARSSASSWVYAYDYVGGIIGYATKSKVNDCTNTGDCSTYAYGQTSKGSVYSHIFVYGYVGGVVGTTDSSVQNCHNIGTISGGTTTYTSTSTKAHSGRVLIGGIAGSGTGTIDRCYNTGTCVAEDDTCYKWIAGITGLGNNVENCSSTGKIENVATSTSSNEQYNAGGIAGTLNGEAKACYSLAHNLFGKKGSSAVVFNCYDNNGTESGSLRELDRFDQASYMGFDFDEVWHMGDGDYQYPVLSDAEIPWELTGISMLTLPQKTKYLANVESLDLTGAKISLSRNGIDNMEILTVTEEMVSGFDNTTTGPQTITITYQAHTVEFTIYVMENDNTNFAGGIGNITYPYVIQTEEQLKKISAEPDANYILANDITLTSENWNPISSFSGTFDGNGHVIRDLRIISGDGNLGLFGTNSGSISNLGVTGSIVVSSVEGDVGGIVAQNNGTISNCFNAVNINVSAKSSREYRYGSGYITTTRSCYAGGIAGRSSGRITNCYNQGDISVRAIKESYNNACGEAIAAGIVVWASAESVDFCYNVGNLNATVDETSSRAETWGIANINLSCSYSGLGAAMTFADTYVGFDFGKIWGIDPFTGYPYPQFKWQLKEMTSISITQDSLLNIEMVEGLWPDMSDVTVRATYTDGSTKDIALVPALLKELDINRVGTQTVHLSCGNIVSEETITFIIKEKEPSTLEVKNLPSKLSYVQGQPLDLDDGVLILTYSNNTTVDVNLVDAQLSYDTDAIGTVTVTATYEGLTVSFDITVNERIVKSVVLTQPAKLSYIVGQELDLSGGIVTVTYVSDDNYSEQIPLELSMLSGYDKDTVGIQTITFNYLEHSETFVVRVVENKVVSIAIAQMPQKLEYNVCQEALNVTGGVITATMLDGSTKEIEMTESMVSGFDNARIGTQTLTVNYEDVTTTYMVEICATVPDSVEIHTLPTKCYYFTGETLDLTGLALKAHYGEKFATITDFEHISEVDMTTAGIKTVSVVFQGIETVFSVYVHEEKAEVITVDSSLYPESDHNYSNNMNELKTFTYPGAVSLTITFNSQTSVESNYDYIYIYDGSDTQIVKYTGTTAASKTLTITGDTFKVKLTSDSSRVKYGYAFSSIKATIKEIIHPAAIDPATATCTQPGLAEGSHCEICGMVLVAQEEMAALGHNYEADFSWNEDHSACAYVLTCSRCADVQTLPCSVAVTDVTQQQTTHCATVAYGGQEYNDTFTCDHALITFKNWDGTQLSSDYYHIGAEIAAPPDPAKAADNTHTYAFAGWDKEVVNCAGDATYTATYTSNYIDYTVVFKNWNGDVISTKTYHYGDKVTAPSDPSRTADDMYTYTFAGWDKDVVDCAGDATYTATYTRSAISKVTFGEKVYHNLRLQDLTKIGYAFTITTDANVDTYGILIWIGSADDEVTVDTEGVQNKTLTYDSGFYTAESDGIYAQQLDVVHYAKPYVKIGDQYIYGNVDTYAPLTYAQTILNGSDAKLKQVMIDLLNYGTYAQLYFAEANKESAPDVLINDILSDEQKVMNWRDDLKATTPQVTKDTDRTLNVKWYGTNLNLLDSIQMNMAATGDITGMYYWTEEDYSNAEVLDGTSASGETIIRTDGIYTIAGLTGIAAQSINDVYYVCGYDANGNLGAIRADSVAAYATRLMESTAATEATINMAKALLVYGNSAKIYFT